ncbi:MAG: hypothetical protein ABW133_15075 [Polyangiaceae bacterium]
MQTSCALWIALGCAALAPLACSDDDPVGSGGTAGTSSTGGAGGTGGEGGAGGSSSPDSGGLTCGGIASIRCPEPDMQYCDYGGKTACGQGDMTGICMPRPDMCTRDCPGVCGCNGTFYCNSCEAHKAGTDVNPNGSCTDASTGTLR